MLPIHPQPHHDELLSSWMVRLAFANGFPLHTFYSRLLGFKEPIWNRDTDRHPPITLLKCLEAQTSNSVSALQALTLSSFEGLVFERFSILGDVPLLLPAGIYHRTRRRAGTQFCPLCLQGDSTPYYRRHWRLAFHATCTAHLCLLQQHCPECRSPIMFHRHGIGAQKFLDEDALRTCHQCRFNLGTSEPLRTGWANLEARQLLHSVMILIESGLWDGGPLRLPLSVAFFNGARILLGAVCGRNGRKLREELGSRLEMEITPQPHLDFEYQTADVRFRLLLAVMWLCGEWPSRFVEVCASANFTRSRLVDRASVLPYWLCSEVDQHLDTRPYLPSGMEIASAIEHLKQAQLPVSTESLGSLLGLKRDVARKALICWK